MHTKPSQPIVHLSMLKSGTHWVREIIHQLTGLDFFEPDIINGGANYQDPNKFSIRNDAMYSWHLYPSDDTLHKIQASNAKVIVLCRNLFDQTVSLYNHFRLNVDEEIGRARNVAHLFNNVSKDVAFYKLIVGCQQDGFYWRGLQHQYLHLRLLYDFSKKCDALFITYEDLKLSPKSSIEKIATFLDISVPSIELLVKNTSFEKMRNEKSNTSHFVNGGIGRCFDISRDSQLIKMLFETVSASFEPIEDHSYLTNINRLQEFCNDCPSSAL